MKLWDILKTWAPLETAWLLMAVEGPFTTAVIARMSCPTLNLAAYGVSFPLAMLFESPIILIMSASAALVSDRDSYLKLYRFTMTLNAIITAAMLLFLIPPIFDWATGSLMGLPKEVTHLAYWSLLLFLPWPAAIGYRRFYQGILIRNRLTHRVAFGTAIRLSSLVIASTTLKHFTAMHGAWIGAASLSVAVTAEAIASRFWARDCVRQLLHGDTQTGDTKTGGTETTGKEALSYGYITRFYTPLAMTAMLTLGVNPLISFFLGRSLMPIESLAVMPVVNSFVFMFNTMGLTFHEVTISLGRKGQEERQALKRFALLLGIVASGLMAIMVFSPLSNLWFSRVYGLPPGLISIATLPAIILFMQPALSVLSNFQRGLLVCARQTSFVSWATMVEVGSIALVLFLLVHAGWIGATAAACALLVGRFNSCVFLGPKVWGLFPDETQDMKTCEGGA